ncbi:membrane-bound PQQ-dependent dehydrogenase, glucose/quinate/shikimate family [Rhizorhapis suberifaciens]|uniref:Quinoprotein glucose dehydrogenase n=1 Tax=Rhizorhapis suberifaciens TaxID=13656 RepID=A0A840HQL8_9SPHN|nr:membrane-bound PQQ-dependent dehydrogenase, glucose/quinate/shikimate family [Rhizorhapis suberifaciens]MBB4640163.1 quinoprotein glucose dehydrogenase [Rhizorhapis suberifaciens]
MALRESGRGTVIAQRAYALLLVVVGAMLVWLGGRLLAVGGSPYYIIAGALTFAAGVLLWRDDRRGAWLYWLMLAGTYGWALWEAGFDGWALAPRLIGPSVLALWLLTPFAYTRLPRSPDRRIGRAAMGAAVVVLVALPLAAGLAFSYGRVSATPAAAFPASGSAEDGDWPVWGRDAAGTRFSPLTQITPGNVGRLEVAWTYRTGFKQKGRPAPFEATPLKIGDLLFLCTPANDVVALEAETGKVRWRFQARSDEKRVGFSACRGVAYYRVPNAVAGVCAERIYTATIDARLLAIDAQTGRSCPAFGQSGAVDLRDGMGRVDKGYYYVTSAPQIIRGKIVFGGWVSDNQHLGEPSGVIRAYDAVTGQFAWAFDVGRPDQHGRPEPGTSYTADTPNSWAPISADEGLGLVFLPMGNAVPDWYGGKRRPFDDKYSSSVVALDAETGAVRWSFQTTHHDLWDYDVASQPTLYDLPVGSGRVPALIQPTKRGEIFVLDRRTGKPLTPVQERQVPRSDVPGERAAPTQPFSIGMPSFGGPTLTEAMMWGLTPIDQAWCRLAFRRSNYNGTMTPATVSRPTIIFPGYVGGSDWGGISIDKDRDILIGNSNRVAMRATLIPRVEADALGIKPIATNVHGDVGGTSAQAGTPFAVRIVPFMSPLNVPCNQPPYGMISGIDMKTRKLLWSHPFGSAHDSGPLGLESHLPFTMGVPNTGGSLITRSGLTIIGATQDRYLRALETRTGRLLWQRRLPAGGQATPMTYLSGSGRQFVVIAAGGNDTLRSKTGDYVMAYALPTSR